MRILGLFSLEKEIPFFLRGSGKIYCCCRVLVSLKIHYCKWIALIQSELLINARAWRGAAHKNFQNLLIKLPISSWGFVSEFKDFPARFWIKIEVKIYLDSSLESNSPKSPLFNISKMDTLILDSPKSLIPPVPKLKIIYSTEGKIINFLTFQNHQGSIFFTFLL